MRSSGLFWFIVFLVVLALVDWYVFQGIKTLTVRLSRSFVKRFIRFSYWGLSLAFFAGVATVLLKSSGRFRLMVLLFVFFLFSYLPKLAFALLRMDLVINSGQEHWNRLIDLIHQLVHAR